MPEFDACIDLGRHNLPAGRDPKQAVAAVLRAVEAIPGAAWIDVQHFAAGLPDPPWLVVYQRGRRVVPDTEQWRQLTARVETAVRAALETAPHA